MTALAPPRRGGELREGRSPFDDAGQTVAAGRFGVWLFLVALAMLFAASVIAFVVVRLQAETWPDLPALPGLLWISTAILLLSSVTMQWACSGARLGDGTSVRLGLLATTALGVLFLIVQTVGWAEWARRLGPTWTTGEDVHRLALAGFFVFTGVHAAHVIGGLVPLTFVTVRALRAARSGAALPAAGVTYCTLYWHFLDGVWVVLFVTLLIGL